MATPEIHVYIFFIFYVLNRKCSQKNNCLKKKKEKNYGHLNAVGSIMVSFIDTQTAQHFRRETFYNKNRNRIEYEFPMLVLC